MIKVRKHIQFDSESHRYTNLETGQIYKSVSKHVSQFHEPFDKVAIATNLIQNNQKYIQKYLGWSQEKAIQDLMNEWEQSATIGTFIHQILEDYAKGKPVLDPNKGESYNARISQLITAWDSLNLVEKYQDWEFCYEHICYHDDSTMAGQADLVVFDHKKQQFVVFDYKTNKKGIKFNSFNGKMMFEPYGLLSDCNYHHYMLQLNYYARFIRLETGYSIKRLALLWVDTNNPDKVEIQPIEIPVFQVFI